MPSSKKKNLKEIYMATSMEDLNKLADVKTQGSNNPTLLSKTADRLYTEALKNDDNNDEERAYIFYLRYVSVITQIRKTNQYKREKAFFDKILGSTKPIKAIEQAERLQKSLSKRYEEQKNLKEEEELAKKLLERKKNEENQAKEKQNGSNKSSSSDVKLDGDSISSPVDLYQKLKVNHSSILTPEGSISNGSNTNDLDSLLPGMTSKVPCLTAEQLYSLMKTVPTYDLLILDIRPQREYAKNHIFNEACINIPAELLEQGVSVSNIDRRLQERTRLVWRERARKQYIIIVDKSTKSTTISPSTKVFQFKEAIYKNDSSCQLMNEPLFLDGGFDEWLWHYPSMATKPELPSVSSNNSSNKLIDVSSLEFPELPVPVETLPSEQQEPSLNTVISNNVNDVYPSLIPTSKSSLKPNNSQNNENAPAAIPGNTMPLQPIGNKPNHLPGPTEARSDLTNPLNPTMLKPQAVEPETIELKPTNNKTVTGTMPQPMNNQVQPLPGQMVKPQQLVPGQSPIQLQPLPQGTLEPSSKQVPVSLIPSVNAISLSSQGTIQGQKPVFPGQQLPPTSVSQRSLPSEPTKQGQPKELPGNPINQNHVPGQLDQAKQPANNVPTNQNNYSSRQTPVNQNRNSDNNFAADSNTFTQPINSGNRPASQTTTSGQPPMYGQTVAPSPQTPNIVNKQAVNQEGAKPIVSSAESRPSGFKTTTGLPPGWEKCIDNSNRVFYKDHNTQTTHWNLPKPTQQQAIPKTNDKIPQFPSKPQFSKQFDSTPGQLKKSKSNLRRSLSSPNLANLDDEIDHETSKPDPVINRSLKPANKPTFNRSAKPLTTQKIDSLNPVRGGVGRGLTGLRNLGNTCYMNSVLQCLFNTAPLVQYFISGAFRDDLNTKNPMGTRGELAEQFSILVRVANSGNYKSLSPVDFKKTVGKIKATFAGFDQQDSQEFLALMMDKLHEDVNTIVRKPYLEAPGDDIEPREAAEISWSNHKKRNKSIMLELFDGLFMSTVRCLVCGKKSVTFETFSNLTLPIPTNSSSCSLQECINLFTRPEKMSGDDKWYCPQCKQHREASKQLQIWKLPPILVIHLKRFQYDGMWRQKLQTGISFPLVDLDMSSYVIGPKSQSPYSLYAVSNHYGTMHGGHYTACCRNPQDKRWYKFDDQLVSEISNSSIVTSAGYLLFYTSIPFQPPKVF